jgi:hypothetical protein
LDKENSFAVNELKANLKTPDISQVQTILDAKEAVKAKQRQESELANEF